MSTPAAEQFHGFFRELHGHEPYPWQQRLAEQVISGAWPGAIDLPTGSGKTACLDIAVFALACQAARPKEERNAARRIFFCVNRRVIVDEAYQRARHIATLIWEAEQGRLPDKPVLREVATALRQISGITNEKLPPLDALELRGGIYRDSRWARSITQPTLICTTLDQLGSRLLFRGYGVSSNAAPIQAALIAYDSLILLDEAHISEPFRQTLGYVERYLNPENWAEQGLAIPPTRVVPMTATPNEDMRANGIITLQEDDRSEPRLQRRLGARKPTALEAVGNVATAAVKQALKLASGQPTAVGIIVNRIATAREIYQALSELRGERNERKRQIAADTPIELVIGSMRPIDRDRQAKRLRSLLGPDRPAVSDITSFTVATQCLEVGADYDFDALITECASLDALLQRFGRLNRAGRTDEANDPINAAGVILIDSKAVKTAEEIEKAEKAEKNNQPLDPIYGDALAATWKWLDSNSEDGQLDFGIDTFRALLDATGTAGPPLERLLAPSAKQVAPVMLPAYLDLWCQTSPRPAPDPDVSLFIHGGQSSEPDVQLCWRADLDEDYIPLGDWCDVVALLPPTSAECVSVPLSRARKLLANPEAEMTNDADVLGLPSESDEKTSSKHRGVLWRGAQRSSVLSSPRDLKPGDTLVLPCRDAASRALAHLPSPDDTPSETPLISDVGDEASAQARDKAVLRIHPALRSAYPECMAVNELFGAACREEAPTKAQWSELLASTAEALEDTHAKLRERVQALAGSSIRIEIYPDHQGVILTSRKRLSGPTDWYIRAMDEGDDESSRTEGKESVSLADHSIHVRDMAKVSLQHLSLEALNTTTVNAAFMHDWGKADERFQAMLRRTDRTDAWLYAGAKRLLLAKSDGVPMTQSQRKAARERAGMPEGFRHEMLSLQLAESSSNLPAEPHQKELALHLIASHHGYARPFAPVVDDTELPSVAFDDSQLTHEDRLQLVPAHRLDSGVGERFWTLTRRYGWWGLAYLEAVLRLADQQASAAENAGSYDTNKDSIEHLEEMI